ncbi:MAG: lipid-A-disaccharide synthase [Sedimentitalea sp.]
MRIFVIAGEPSGDRLGGAVMAALRELAPGITFDGVGGPLMCAQGLSSRFPMDELSVMGLAEVLPKYRALKRRVNEMAAAVIETRPDVLLTIDSPDFCLRVARLAKAAVPVRTVHYVAPTVWAWRPGRAAKMAEMIDHVLALFPFEPPLMQAAGMACDFVGHPVVGEPVASAQECAALRGELNVGDGPLVVALPGSRGGEVTRLAPVFGQALERLARAVPGVQAVVPAAAPVADLVAQFASDWSVPTTVIDPRAMAPEEAALRKRAAFGAADVALAASGTVSLELAAAATPMVVAYRLHWLTWQIMSRMALTDTVTLVNLVSETRVVPECLGPECTPELISAQLQNVLSAPERQSDAMGLTMKRLGQGGQAPGLRAARALLDRLDFDPTLIAP